MGITTKSCPLNRDAIKYIAMFAMLLNHIGIIFCPYGSQLREILIDIGYFTAITMCYFLVEGYGHTHSKRKYGQRLLCFAAISQIPYMIAFGEHGKLTYQGMSMIYTLLLCFLILVIGEKVDNRYLRRFLRLILVLFSGYGDWPYLAALYTLLFEWAGISRTRLKVVYPAAASLFFVMDLLHRPYSLGIRKAMQLSACGTIGIFVSGICILHLYNGKRMEKGKAFSKWFFYLFYPLHLLVLGLLACVLA